MEGSTDAAAVAPPASPPPSTTTEAQGANDTTTDAADPPASSTPIPAASAEATPAPASTVDKKATSKPATEDDVDMAVPTIVHPVRTVSPVAAATLPSNTGNPGLNLPMFNGFPANGLGLSAPASSQSTTPQPFQVKSSPVTPSPSVKPADVTPTPDASASSASKVAPVVAGMGTLPPNVTAASGPSSSTADSLRAIPTNKNNPAFLNKLRSMVDDPNTDELIRWSPDGASFFVPNHVRFGDEVLPRFFKHNRFSSFVRQLNMYGFHKVPHLQQGALKHDSPQESELWEFSNPHFHRDHPDWLSKVQRKKGPRDEKEHGEREASASTGQELMHAGALMRTDFGAKALGVDTDSGDGALQLASVLNAINAIKNAQTSISADLRHLQNSNQNLWQEAVESRQRAKRQQETINKILRFLAGVFGNQDEEAPVQGGKRVSGKGRGTRRGGVRPQQQRGKSRLMIEDGKSTSPLGLEALELPADGEEIEEMPAHLRFQEASNGDSPKTHSPSTNNGGSRFTQIGSPPSNSNSHAAAEFGRQLHEAVSTPGGSRRLSSQASNQVLNALASGEGNAWLASLFGASLANQGSKTTGPASGGGLKLDPQMVAALQQALASAGGGNSNAGSGVGNMGDNNSGDYFDAGLNGGDDFSSRFSAFPSSSGSDLGQNSQSSSSRSGSSSGSNSNQGLGLDADALARIAGISQALVQSPARQNYNTGSNNNNNNNNLTFSSPSKGAAAGLFDGDDGGMNNQQLALSLSRATRDLNGTSENVDQLNNSINSLIEGLQTNPQLLQNIANQQTSSNGSSAQQNLPPSMAWQNAMSSSEPSAASFGSGIPIGPYTTNETTTNAGGSGLTPPSTSAAQNTDVGGLGTDFDVDSFLSQFVDTSQAPGGGVTSPTTARDPGMGESPSFAFSPATTAAFLHGAGADQNGIFAEPNSGSASGTSSSTASPPGNGAAGKKRKPSTSGVNGLMDVDMEVGGGRPNKKSAGGRN